MKILEFEDLPPNLQERMKSTASELSRTPLPSYPDYFEMKIMLESEDQNEEEPNIRTAYFKLVPDENGDKMYVFSHIK